MSNMETGRGDAPPGFAYPAWTESDAGPARNGADVVLLHGFMATPWTMQMMGRILRRDGFTPHLFWYESWANPFDAIVTRIARLMETKGFGRHRPVHFVGHSMGGLVARAAVARLDLPYMGRMVMIGPPNGGSELADFCTRWRILRPVLGHAGATLVTRRILPLLDDLPPPAYPVGVIAGDRPLANLLRIMPAPHDGKVSVASTHLTGEADHIVLPVSHTIMPFHSGVHAQTARFLQTGGFEHS